MQVMPIDLTALVAVILGTSIFLVPIIGLTARFALKPTVETLSRFFDHKGLDETVQIMERRLALMEQQMEALESGVRRLEEAREFHEALASPQPSERLGAGKPPAS